MSLGVVFLLDKPKRPPTILMFLSLRAFTISKYNGSPFEPASFVLSSTAIFLIVLGNTSNKYLGLKGRYKWTITKPTFLLFFPF